MNPAAYHQTPAVRPTDRSPTTIKSPSNTYPERDNTANRWCRKENFNFRFNYEFCLILSQEGSFERRLANDIFCWEVPQPHFSSASMEHCIFKAVLLVDIGWHIHFARSVSFHPGTLCLSIHSCDDVRGTSTESRKFPSNGSFSIHFGFNPVAT